MYCKNCGKQLPDGAKFCKYCGTNLAVKKDAPITPKSQEPVYDRTEILSGNQANPTASPYEKTEILFAPGQDPKASSEFSGNQNEAPAGGEFMAPKVTYNNPGELQVTKEKTKKRWPLVLLLLLVIFLSLGVLGALFIFPDQVEDLIAGVTGDRSSISSVDDDKDEDSKEKEDSDDKEPAEEEEEDVDVPEWGKAYSEAIDSVSKNTWPYFSMADINGDGTPEVIGRKNAGVPGRIIMTYDEDNGLSSITTNGDFITYSTSAGMIQDSYTEGKTAYDVLYEMNSKGFEKIFEGSYSMDSSANFTSTGDPAMIYKADGMEVDSSAYYSNFESLYLNKGIQDESEMAAVEYDTMMEILGKEDPETEFEDSAKVQDLEKEWNYSFVEAAQYFEAPYSGTYRFSLYGGNGGGDDERDYDAEAAVLIGTMSLKAGERVIVLTGGCGGINKYYFDTVRGKGCVVPGGFNGGGECFASGGGGGCTDIYYRGVRVAAAAGSGGGNYDEYGQPGRTSASRDHITSNKLGAGTQNLDIGGGGAGWFGGTIGKVDQPGMGGVNGWDGSFFNMEQEFEGKAFSMSGNHEGSALIQYVGK